MLRGRGVELIVSVSGTQFYGKAIAGADPAVSLTAMGAYCRGTAG